MSFSAFIVCKVVKGTRIDDTNFFTSEYGTLRPIQLQEIEHVLPDTTVFFCDYLNGDDTFDVYSPLDPWFRERFSLEPGPIYYAWDHERGLSVFEGEYLKVELIP